MKQLAFGLVLAVLLCQACATKQHRGETSEPAKEEEQRAASDAQTNKTSSTAAPDIDTRDFPKVKGLILVMEPADALSKDGEVLVQIMRDFQANADSAPAPPFPLDRTGLTPEEGQQLSAWHTAYHEWLATMQFSREEFEGALATLESNGKADTKLVYFALGLTLVEAYTQTLKISAPVQSFGCDGQTPSTTLFAITQQTKNLADSLSEVPPRSDAVKYSAGALEEHSRHIDALLAKTIKLDDFCDMQHPR